MRMETGVELGPSTSYARRMWDERYGSVDWAYGQEPNDFLREQLAELRVKPGRALCLAEGEGRNGMHLARQGWQVTGVDSSSVGLEKFARWADSEGLKVETVACDLADYDLGQSGWDLIVSVWCHVPPRLRRDLHAAVVRALKPGGWFILEAYHPRQLEFKTGGPPVAELMMSTSVLEDELQGLDVVISEEIEREVHEGPFHDGYSAVTRILAQRPDR